MADSPRSQAGPDRHCEPEPSLASWPDWPDYGLVNDLFPTLAGWHAQGLRFALATLVHIDGSSPRPLGAEMAISERGECAGYVSGGCVEAAVAAEALQVLETGQPRLLDYGAGSPAIDIELSCGGRIHVWVEQSWDVSAWLARWHAARVERRLFEDPLRWRGENGAQCLLRRRLPTTRLVAVGGDPVVLALSRMAPALGLELTLLRPSGPGVAPADLGHDRYDPRPLEWAVHELSLDAWTAVYALTHDADTDHLILKAALESEAFCVGALGSRRKAALRLERLAQEGIGLERLACLHSPAGLDIGAQTPQQIALSILGQVIAEQPR